MSEGLPCSSASVVDLQSMADVACTYRDAMVKAHGNEGGGVEGTLYTGIQCEGCNLRSEM
jgi:hypothetical protein